MSKLKRIPKFKNVKQEHDFCKIMTQQILLIGQSQSRAVSKFETIH